VASILIAEDDAHIVRVLALWLRRNGHDVAEARTGRDALERLREGGIELMVTDVNMPGLTGIELLATASAEGLLPSGAVVLTSRCDQREIAEAVKNAGGVVHPKPFSPSGLLTVIEQKLRSRVTPAPNRS
jgi:CheY-like chemotaxis protein